MIALINIADARFHCSLWVLLIVLLMIYSVDQKKNPQPPSPQCVSNVCDCFATLR